MVSEGLNNRPGTVLSETWTIKELDTRMEGFEIWTFRRMENISSKEIKKRWQH